MMCIYEYALVGKVTVTTIRFVFNVSHAWFKFSYQSWIERFSSRFVCHSELNFRIFAYCRSFNIWWRFHSAVIHFRRFPPKSIIDWIFPNCTLLTFFPSDKFSGISFKRKKDYVKIISFEGFHSFKIFSETGVKEILLSRLFLVYTTICDCEWFSSDIKYNLMKTLYSVGDKLYILLVLEKLKHF